ncbi:MAG: TrkA family potassium uptake protein [Lentisphaeria bacterium]|nr:TrkA family potassium uptake protein [Lentisphaerota bacterium]MBR2625396.1 TrkA family potassium uptake protein [Lentisphaeria bacterium]
MAKNSYAVFGMGTFGAKLATELARSGNTVLICDRDVARIEELKDKVSDAVIADVTIEEVVRELNVDKFDAVILGMSSYFESQVLALTLLKQAGAKKVFIKSKSAIQEKILYRLGADEVIQPELDVASRLARKLSLSNISDIFEFKGSAIADVIVPPALENIPLRDLDLRGKHNITILLKYTPDGLNVCSIGPDTTLKAGDQLTVFGDQKSIIELFRGN